jgi:tRNA-splicing ligase RtcB (3'-phosphate/5'-hydroxy nucleic acid ligase)
MSKQGYGGPLEQIDECCWQIPEDCRIGMRVEGRIFADERLIGQICKFPSNIGESASR